MEKLLASWDGDESRRLESAHRWEGTAMEAIDALSALLGEVDLAGSGPVLVSQRART